MTTIEYDVFFVHRQCCSRDCTNIVTNFAAPKGSDPKTVAVWCRQHAAEAYREPWAQRQYARRRPRATP